MSSTTGPQRAQRRREVARRLRLGESYSEIAQAVEVSKSTVARDVDHLREQWREDATRDIEEHFARELAELRDIKRQARRAWEESKGGVVEEKTRTEGAGHSAASVSEEGELDSEVVITDVEKAVRKVKKSKVGTPGLLYVQLSAQRQIIELLGLGDYDGHSNGGDRLQKLVDVMEATAEEVDHSQFNDEKIR